MHTIVEGFDSHDYTTMALNTPCAPAAIDAHAPEINRTGAVRVAV